LLKKGDELAVIGSLKPTQWEDRNTGETKHGLSITLSWRAIGLRYEEAQGKHPESNRELNPGR
jgi:hypothetical protein